MSLCDHIPSILDVFKVNFEINIYEKYIYIGSINGEIYKIEQEHISDVMKGQRNLKK